MIEFKDGKNSVVVTDFDGHTAQLKIKNGDADHQYYYTYVTKETYALLEQAMPHIKAVVEGDAPEIFPGTNKALDKIGVRKE